MHIWSGVFIQRQEILYRIIHRVRHPRISNRLGHSGKMFHRVKSSRKSQTYVVFEEGSYRLQNTIYVCSPQ